MEFRTFAVALSH